MYKFSPEEIVTLKKHAKVLKKTLGIAHAQALDRVANDNGYTNWSLLQKHSSANESMPRVARVFGEDEQPGGVNCITVACVRYQAPKDYNKYFENDGQDSGIPDLLDFYNFQELVDHPDHPGMLVFRCPLCNEVHYYWANDHHFGAGNGERDPVCKDSFSDFILNLIEVEDRVFAGSLPHETLLHVVIPLKDEDIKGWYRSTHLCSSYEIGRRDLDVAVDVESYRIMREIVQQYPDISIGWAGRLSDELASEGVWRRLFTS